jgi:hypothetical protein
LTFAGGVTPGAVAVVETSTGRKPPSRTSRKKARKGLTRPCYFGILVGSPKDGVAL